MTIKKATDTTRKKSQQKMVPSTPLLPTTIKITDSDDQNFVFGCRQLSSITWSLHSRLKITDKQFREHFRDALRKSARKINDNSKSNRRRGGKFVGGLFAKLVLPFGPQQCKPSSVVGTCDDVISVSDVTRSTFRVERDDNISYVNITLNCDDVIAKTWFEKCVKYFVRLLATVHYNDMYSI